MMGVFCRRCRAPMRSRNQARTIHVRCQLRHELADDIYQLRHELADDIYRALYIELRAPVTRIAADFGVDYAVMKAALKMASRRRRGLEVRRAT